MKAKDKLRYGIVGQITLICSSTQNPETLLGSSGQ